MATVEIRENPRRRRRRRLPPRGAGGKFRKRGSSRRRTTRRRRRRNPTTATSTMSSYAPRRRAVSNPRRRRRRRNCTTRRTNPTLSPGRLLREAQNALPDAIASSATTLGAWITTKTVLPEGRDTGLVGYGTNLATGALLAGLGGTLTRSPKIFRAMISGAVNSVLLRVAIDVLRGRAIPGIRTGFEDYGDYLVGVSGPTGYVDRNTMADYLTFGGSNPPSRLPFPEAEPYGDYVADGYDELGQHYGGAH